MTYKFSQKSIDLLKGVHPKLVATVFDVMDMQVMDFSVKEGVRTVERQRDLVARRVSWTMQSKHLVQSDGYGHAVDLYPSPIDMQAVIKGNAKEIIRFGVLAGMMFAAARERGIIIRWGGDFNMDGRTMDNRSFDAPHMEIHKIL